MSALGEPGGRGRLGAPSPSGGAAGHPVRLRPPLRGPTATLGRALWVTDLGCPARDSCPHPDHRPATPHRLTVTPQHRGGSRRRSRAPPDGTSRHPASRRLARHAAGLGRRTALAEGSGDVTASPLSEPSGGREGAAALPREVRVVGDAMAAAQRELSAGGDARAAAPRERGLRGGGMAPPRSAPSAGGEAEASPPGDRLVGRMPRAPAPPEASALEFVNRDAPLSLAERNRPLR